MYLTSPRLGQPQKSEELVLGPASFVWKMPHFRCNAAQLAKVKGVMGPTVTAAEARRLIMEAAEEGKRLAEQAWFKLHDPKLPADVEQLFTTVFGIGSTSRAAGGSTMRAIVIARYEGALRKLSNDAVHVSCWGWPWGGITGDDPEKYLTNNVTRRHGIALGKQFWVRIRDGDSTSAAAALLGSALSLFYHRFRFKASAPRTVRAACYQRFAILAAGKTVPEWIEKLAAAK